MCDIAQEGLCNVGRSRYAGVITALWEALVCPKTEDEEFYHRRIVDAFLERAIDVVLKSSKSTLKKG